MKMLVVTDKLYPDEIGGSCTYAYEIIKSIEDRASIDIFTGYPAKVKNDSKFQGEVYRGFNKLNLAATIKNFVKIYNNKKYKCIVFNTAFSWFIYYLSKPFLNYEAFNIAIFHGPWHKEALIKYEGQNKPIMGKCLSLAMKNIEKIYCSNNDNFIFLSEYMKNELFLINKKIKDKNTKIIPGGVNLKNYSREYSKSEAKKKLGLKDSDYVIFILRRLEKRMGIDRGIKAINLLPEELKSNIVLNIGGKGTYEEALKEIASDSDFVCNFIGYIPDENINLHFCAADLFLVPSIDLEGFGLVNLESLAMGVPVLATPQGGMLELSGKFEGFHMAEGLDEQSISDKIASLYKNNECNYIKEEVINKYDWNEIGNQFLDFIDNLVCEVK